MITNRAPKLPGKALGSRVLAERNQACAAVGAWVESGEELQEHPACVAAVTEQMQLQWRTRSEHELRLFQENVRLRVAEQERCRRRDRPQGALFTSEGDRGNSHPERPQDRPQSEARRRLACRPHTAEGHMTGHMTHRADGDEGLSACEDPPESEGAEPAERAGPVYRALWPVDQSEEQRRQRQTQLLTQRRLFLSKDRQNVKENQELKRHLQRTASLKQQKERERLEEEQRLKEARLLSAAQHALEERERLVQKALSEEREERDERETETGDGEKRDKRRVSSSEDRQVSSLRVQLRALFSDSEPPDLCCCGSFWETHPQTCANNCVFYHNHKEYIRALQTALHSWDLLL